MNKKENSRWRNNFTEEFTLEEILFYKEYQTAESHTWIYQDRIGLKIYSIKTDKFEEILDNQNSEHNLVVWKKRCTWKVANAAAKLLGVKHIIHIKHHYRSVK